MLRMSVRGTITARTRVSPNFGLGVFDHVRFGGPFHEFTEFLLTEERLVAARRTGGHGAPQGHEPSRDRSQHPREETDHRCGEAHDGAGVEPSKLARRDSHDDESQEGHDAGCGQPGQPDVVDQAVQQDSDGDR
jgi:hypothetical protein